MNSDFTVTLLGQNRLQFGKKVIICRENNYCVKVLYSEFCILAITTYLHFFFIMKTKIKDNLTLLLFWRTLRGLSRKYCYNMSQKKQNEITKNSSYWDITTGFDYNFMTSKFHQMSTKISSNGLILLCIHKILGLTKSG